MRLKVCIFGSYLIFKMANEKKKLNKAHLNKNLRKKSTSVLVDFESLMKMIFA